jgi:hypothetical protein
MTWGEWISSSYNTSNLKLAPDNYVWFEAVTYLFTDAKCTQKCHKDDVITTRAYYGNYSGYVDMMTFEIDGTAYQAEQGMTWSQWVSSKYNVDGYVISGTTVYNSDKSKKIASVTSSSTISTNSKFSLTSVSTGTVTHGGGSN